MLMSLFQQQIKYNKMLSSNKINPQLSLLNEKNELKKVNQNVQTMRNRVQLLRLQLQKQKDGVKKHKQLTKQTIQKKIEVNKIYQYKQKDNSQQNQRAQYLRKRNQQLRLSHEKQLQDIQKAVYLVKLDDARQLKNISLQHNKKLNEMNRQFLTRQQSKKKKVEMESQQAKDRYVQYWKQKLANIYTENAQNIIKSNKLKEEGKMELYKLQQQEMKLMQEINNYHSKGVESKKQYLAALSIPVKEVAEAMSNENNSMLSRRRSMVLNHSTLQPLSSQTARYSQKESIRIPNAHVNQDKLKVVLQQLKKMDRNNLHTSR